MKWETSMWKILARIMAMVISMEMLFGIAPITVLAEVATPADTALPSGDLPDGGLSLGNFGNPATLGTTMPIGAIIITAFDELTDEVLWQGYDYGVIESMPDLNLPDTLTGTNEDGESVTIESVTWQSKPDFDPDVSIDPPGYVFTQVLPNGYMLADGVTAPIITVTVPTDKTFLNDMQDLHNPLTGVDMVMVIQT